jgi:hypothetical protein
MVENPSRICYLHMIKYESFSRFDFLSILMRMRVHETFSSAFRQRGRMLRFKSSARSLGCLAVMAVAAYSAGNSQTGMSPSGNTTHDYSGIPMKPPDANPVPDANRFLESSLKGQDNRKQIEQLNQLRQREMNADTDKLVILAIQLKAETDATSREKLTVIDLHKAEAIEKLAKSVREKMKATVGN